MLWRPVSWMAQTQSLQSQDPLAKGLPFNARCPLTVVEQACPTLYAPCNDIVQASFHQVGMLT